MTEQQKKAGFLPRLFLPLVDDTIRNINMRFLSRRYALFFSLQIIA